MPIWKHISMAYCFSIWQLVNINKKLNMWAIFSPWVYNSKTYFYDKCQPPKDLYLYIVIVFILLKFYSE